MNAAGREPDQLSGDESLRKAFDTVIEVNYCSIFLQFTRTVPRGPFLLQASLIKNSSCSGIEASLIDFNPTGTKEWNACSTA